MLWSWLLRLASRLCLLGCLLCTVALSLLLACSTFMLQREAKTTAVKESRRVEELTSRRHCIETSSSAVTGSCTFGYVLQRGVCVQCPTGKFSLPNWVACEPLLGCEPIEHEVTRLELLHSLVHWRYYKADWKGYEVVYAIFNILAKSSVNYSELQSFSSSQYILYPIGSCKRRNIILFASNWNFIEAGNSFEFAFLRFPVCNHCMIRLHIAMSYLRVLVRLHSVNTVLCNSRTLRHLLSQFLITDSFSLVLSALDNLPQDASGPILCQQREMKGGFVAPEQKWPYGETKIFNPDEQPKYDHTTDIWKVPQVVSRFMTSCEEVMDYLEMIHLHCRASDPQLRPTAAQLLKEYEYVWDLLYKDDVFL